MRAKVLYVVLFAMVGVALALDVTPYESDAVAFRGDQVGTRAGNIAGQRAGAEAGKQAGFVAAKGVVERLNRVMGTKLSVADVLPVAGQTSNQAASDVAKVVAPMSTQEWRELSKSNPGATSYFREFDKDANSKWSKSEWDAAIANMIKRRYLPGSFLAKSTETWNSLPKTATGELTLREFLTWSAQTPAHAPIKEYVAAESHTFSPSLKTCEDVYNFYDADHNNALDLTEFRAALQGRVPDDSILDTWYSLPRSLDGNTMTLATWSNYCVDLTGLPPGPQTKREFANPCEPNPCKETGTVCMRDPQVCTDGSQACAQFKCVQTGGSAKPSVYSTCIAAFNTWDTNKNKKLDEKEFSDGLAKAQAAKQISNAVNAKVQWNHFDMTISQSEIDVYQFVHFCVAVANEGADNGGTAKEECWDVYTNFDTNRDQKLSQSEFDSGMRVAKSNGHIPISMDTNGIWAVLPKSPDGETVEPGTFINWCLGVSSGVDPVQAAKSTIASKADTSTGTVPTKPNPYGGGVPAPAPAPTTSYQGVVYGGTVSNASTSTVAQTVQRSVTAALDLKLPLSTTPVTKQKTFCDQVFEQAKAGSYTAGLQLDQFHYVCRTIAPRGKCTNYPALFTEADKDKSGDLSAEEFGDVCTHGGVVTHTTLSADQARAIAAKAGEEAGRVAGAAAGATAGGEAGHKAGYNTIGFQFREVTSGMGDAPVADDMLNNAGSIQREMARERENESVLDLNQGFLHNVITGAQDEDLVA